MKPRLSILTLGVNDLETSTTFYTETLGWTKSKDSNTDITFIEMNQGTVLLSLYPRNKLAEDATVDDTTPKPKASFQGFTMAHTVASIEAVDQIFQELEKKQVQIVKKPKKAFWGGYSGYLADPDGNLWEIAYNPFMNLVD